MICVSVGILGALEFCLDVLLMSFQVFRSLGLQILKSLLDFMKHICPCVQPFWLQLLFFDLILASMGDADEDDLGRNKADPSISVADLEQCLERFFTKAGSRNMQEVLDLVKEANTTWTSSAQEMLCKARLIGFDLSVGVFSILSFRPPSPTQLTHPQVTTHQTTSDHIILYIYIYILYTHYMVQPMIHTVSPKRITSGCQTTYEALLCISANFRCQLWPSILAEAAPLPP